jgi:hypothetical protein
VEDFLKPEAAVQRAVLDLLAAERVLAFRMNSGALMGASGRPISFGVKGMADVLALPMVPVRNVVTITETPLNGNIVRPLWIECKSAVGRQSAEQKSFQELVERHGCTYIVARSSDEVLAWLRANEAKR